MLILKGFQFTEIIHQDAKTAVYRGIRVKDRRPVMAKAFKDEYPLLAEIIKLEREFELMKEVGQPGVIGLHSLEKVGRQKVLIMEDMGGRPLKEVMGGPADIRPLLETVIAVTAILDRIHRHNIVHQDIKPSNILFNPDTGEVQIVDFSTAARVQNGICPAVIPERMEGPPAYISPEQTGRMNRPVDFRSDLYSLGVTFYELLAGRLPFDGRDPMELIHAHIARQPVPPDVDRRIPGVVCRIVMKLLSKMAEDRYQSASGLRADLETCLNKLDKADRIEPFEIGRKDSTGRFRIPEKMYGREEEKGILRDEYDRVARGDFRIALVTGPSGIGKTRLVNEFEKQVLGKNGYFASGKCDFLKGDIPYNGLISGFKDLINQLLTLPPEKLEGIKVELVAALGESGQLLVDMIPELELIVG
ncbi:MAG: AAA family ATPase, partial [Proteobacteria bacterium]|nr:AAA family ATPase [Pseudomonadota bacterium]